MGGLAIMNPEYILDVNYFSWKCISIFIEVVIFYIFVETTLEKRACLTRIKRSLKYLYLLLDYLILCGCSFLSSTRIDFPSFVCYIVFFIMGLVYVSLFYAGTIKRRMTFGILYTFLCIAADYLVIFIPQTITGIESYPTPVLFSGGLMTSYVLRNFALIAVVFFAVRMLRSENSLLTKPHKIVFAVFSLIGILIAHYMTLTSIRIRSMVHSEQIVNRLALINIFLIMLFITLLAYIYMLGRSTDANMKLLKQQKIHELEAMEYQNLIRSTETLREMKHDVQIHLDVIQNLAADGKTDDLLSYINTYHTALEHTHHFISTGNAAIDCIVSSRLEMAYNLGIETDTSILLPNEFAMDSLELSSMLGNLWTNAIEACQKVTDVLPDYHPQIQFAIKPFKDMVLIHMENDYDGNILQSSDGTYRSTKEGNDHGIGLKRIKDIVKENDGIMQIRSENKHFQVQIMIPVKERGLVV